MVIDKNIKRVKKIKYSFFILILIIVLISSYTSAADIDYLSKQKLIEDLNLSEDITIIKRRYKDITGDNEKDQVFLVGQRLSEPQSPYYSKVEIIVYDVDQKKYYLTTDEKFSGYEPKLELFDFTADNTKDIYIEANTGGSGGIYNHLIVTFTNNSLKIIFDESNNRGLSIEGKYMDDFKAVLEIKQLNKEIELDLNFNKEQYLNEDIYNKKGEILKEIKPFTYPFEQFEVIDYDLDNSFELRGIQRIVGAYGADTIGYLITILKYEDGWKYKQAEIRTYLKQYDFSY